MQPVDYGTPMGCHQLDAVPSGSCTMQQELCPPAGMLQPVLALCFATLKDHKLCRAMCPETPADGWELHRPAFFPQVLTG